MLKFPSFQASSPIGNTIGATDNQVAFNGALNNIYDAFGAIADKEQISLLMACRIVNHFDELVSHDERQPGGALPSKLGDALVPLIVSNKKEGDLVLYSQDFLAALDMLKTFTTDREILFVLDSCKNADMNSFLADGLKRYNNHPVAIGRNVQFQTTLIDCWQVLNNNQMLSPLDNGHLSQLSATYLEHHYGDDTFWMSQLTDSSEVKKSINELLNQGMTGYEIFKSYPEFRQERFLFVDQEGMVYLKENRGFECGPELRALLKSGSIDLAQVQSFRQTIKMRINYELSWPKRHLPDNYIDQIFKLTEEAIFTGGFSKEYLADAPLLTSHGVLLKKWVNYKQSDVYIALGKIIRVFADPWVQQKIEDKLITFEQVFKSYNQLGLTGLQKCVDINKLTVKELIELPKECTDFLARKNIQGICIDYGHEKKSYGYSLRKLIAFSPDVKQIFSYGLCSDGPVSGFLCFPRIHSGIPAVKIAYQELNRLSSGAAKVLANQYVFESIQFGHLKFEFFSSLCETTMRSLHRACVEGNISELMQKIVNMSGHKRNLLLDNEIQRAMGDNKITLEEIIDGEWLTPKEEGEVRWSYPDQRDVIAKSRVIKRCEGISCVIS